MKFFQYLLTFGTSLLFIVSCSSDTCTSEEWAGTWKGTITDLDGIEQETLVTISAVDDNTINFSHDDTDYGNINISGCSFSQDVIESTFLGDVSISLSADLSGDIITLDIAAELLGESITERAILNRQ